MADRTKQHLVIYKGDEKVTEGEVGASTATITGLTAGTAVKEGDYTLAWSDGTKESAKVAIPAFTVPTPAPDEPTEVTVKATADGANVTAK